MEDVKINEITDKEESRKQFLAITKELNLKHTFSFDEAWDFMQHKREQKIAKQNFRNAIIGFEDAAKNHPLTFSDRKDIDKANPLKHTFTDGICVREITNPKGIIIVTNIHKREHPYFLLKGEMSILTENGEIRIKAPHYGITAVGTKRIIYTHSECVFCTIHATNERDIDKLEEEFFTKSYDNIKEE